MSKKDRQESKKQLQDYIELQDELKLILGANKELRELLKTYETYPNCWCCRDDNNVAQKKLYEALGKKVHSQRCLKIQKLFKSLPK